MLPYSYNLLIIGLDLSFNSTGITTVNIPDDPTESILTFHRITHENNIPSSNAYNPIVPANDPVNTHYYSLHIPEYINYDDSYTISTTYQAIQASRKVAQICESHLKDQQIIYIGIENYIMPKFGGKHNLTNVSGLIMMQGYVRQFFMNYAIKNKRAIHIITPSPTTIKKFFCGNGKAEKEDMMKSFISNYDGGKLIPNISVKDTTKLNDIVDSFAIAMYVYSQLSIHKPTYKQTHKP
jgi:Holliday junction resolvasome RuvABC endonuclease subunit